MESCLKNECMCCARTHSLSHSLTHTHTARAEWLHCIAIGLVFSAWMVSISGNDNRGNNEVCAHWEYLKSACFIWLFVV